MPIYSSGAGHPTATAFVPYPLIGDYKIKVMPKSDARPVDTYTITAEQNGVVTTIAKDVRVQDTPTEDFSFSPALYLGSQLDSWSVSDGSVAYLLLYEPGSFSPFEHLGYYASPITLPSESFRTSVVLGSHGSLPITPYPDRSLIQTCRFP